MDVLLVASAGPTRHEAAAEAERTIDAEMMVESGVEIGGEVGSSAPDIAECTELITLIPLNISRWRYRTYTWSDS